MGLGVLEQTTPEVVTVKTMSLPPKCMALLKACRAREASRYAIQHAFAIDGAIYTTDGRIAASVTPPENGTKLDDGTYLMVGNELFKPVEYNGGRYPKANDAFLSDNDKVEEMAGDDKSILTAMVKHKIYLDVFKFYKALRALSSMELSNRWLHIKTGILCYPVMVSGQYSLLGGKTHKWGIRVVMMTFDPQINKV